MDEGSEDLTRDKGDPEFQQGPASVMKTVGGYIVEPTENELRLGRRVLELEKERDSLADELAALKARHLVFKPANSINENGAMNLDQPVEIPSTLLPLLGILRTHIAELTKDNQALRYTFLGQAMPRRGPITNATTPVSAQPPSLPNPSLLADGKADVEMVLPAGDPKINSADAAPALILSPDQPDTGGLDLEKVVVRVRALVQENEELGEMVMEAGRLGDEEQWQRALEDSKAIIESLDSDLSHHLSVLKTTRSELLAYKTHYGPLPSEASYPTANLMTTSTSAPVQARSPFVGGRGGAPERGGRGGGKFISRAGRGKSSPMPVDTNATSGSGGPGRRTTGNGNDYGNHSTGTNTQRRGGSMSQGQYSRDERGFKCRR
ncbi:hypothetical protein L204_101970 [Cryptococcus depauperatus]